MTLADDLILTSFWVVALQFLILIHPDLVNIHIFCTKIDFVKKRLSYRCERLRGRMRRDCVVFTIISLFFCVFGGEMLAKNDYKIH